MSEVQSGEARTVRPYILGFVYSIALTLLAYFIIQQQLVRGWGVIPLLLLLASLQLLVQLVFFLQLGRRTNRQWTVLVSILALTVIFIVGGGSLWIMYNLASRMMPAM